LLDVSTAIASTIYWLLPSSNSPEDRRGISLTIFISPAFIVPVFFLCWLILENILPIIMVVLVIWGPLGTIATPWMRLAPSSDYRDTVAFMIIVSPFLLAFAVSGIEMYGMIALTLFQNTLYFCLQLRRVLSRPRFRGSNPFAGTQLCGECWETLARSGLLFGRWSLLTKAGSYPYLSQKQSHPRPMQSSYPLYIVMTSQFEQLPQTNDFRNGFNDFPKQCVELTGRESANAVIKIRWV
jgi:hypothetical protein